MPSKSLTAVTSFWKWEKIDRPCHSKDNGDIAEVYKKTVAVTKDIDVGDIMKSFHKTLLKSKSSWNPKKNHATEFQGDINHHNQLVLQADNAQAYQCELQNETVGAVWTQGILSLFTCTVCHNLDTKTLIFRTDYKRNNKFPIWLLQLHSSKWQSWGRNYLIWRDKKNFFNSKISSCMY